MVRTWVLVCLLALAGCDSGGDPAPDPGPPAGDPLSQVRVAAAKTAGVPSHVTLTAPDVEVAGDTDPPGKALTLTVTTDEIEQRVRVIAGDAWLTLGATYLPNLDPTKFIKFPAADFAKASLVYLGDPFDPAGIKGLSAAMTEATRTGEGVYTGKLTLVEALSGESRGLLPATAEQLRTNGGESQSVPYEAAVDGQGYLTKLTVTLPTYASTATFTDFNKSVQVQKPAPAEVTDIPESTRRLLTG